LQAIREDTQSSSKLYQSLANMKADKKDFAELRAKVISSIQEMVTSAEFTSAISNMSSDMT